MEVPAILPSIEITEILNPHPEDTAIVLRMEVVAISPTLVSHMTVKQAAAFSNSVSNRCLNLHRVFICGLCEHLGRYLRGRAKLGFRKVTQSFFLVLYHLAPGSEVSPGTRKAGNQDGHPKFFFNLITSLPDLLVELSMSGCKKMIGSRSLYYRDAWLAPLTGWPGFSQTLAYICCPNPIMYVTIFFQCQIY
jgi:hypothetical protein